MHIQLGFSGPAGSGVNTAGMLLAELLASKGYTIRADKEYASIIKGDNNNFFLSISDDGSILLPKKVDIFLTFDDYSVTKNQEIYDLQNIVNIKSVAAKHKNTFAFGVALRMLNISLEEGKSIIQTFMKEKYREENFIELENGYTYGQEQCNDLCTLVHYAQKIGPAKPLMFGNELVAKGAIQSGLEFYSAYPMTPASSISDVILEDPSVTYYQGEDEIAVAMSMLGARFAGKRAMCGTSGGGFALMTESISFAHQAEIGGVYILSQRDGPSTGTPTFTAQGDLAYAMNASFGETSPIVMAPSTFEEAYSMMGQALNWSDRYQHPLIILLDKQLSEGYLTINQKKLTLPKIDRGEIATGGGEDTYLRYKDTKSGISPYAIPGTENTLFIATSYEHEESGTTNENPLIKDQQMQKRFRKRLTFTAQEFAEDFVAYEVINPHVENFFVTRGINRYNIESLIKKKPDRGLIIIKVFHPFSFHLPEFFKNHENQIKKLIFIEMNYEGQMERVVRQECNLTTPERNKKISHHRKYTLYPIFIEELEQYVK